MSFAVLENGQDQVPLGFLLSTLVYLVGFEVTLAERMRPGDEKKET